MSDPIDPVVARDVNRLPRRQRARWEGTVVRLMARGRDRVDAEESALMMELEMGEEDAMFGLNRDDDDPSASNEK